MAHSPAPREPLRTSQQAYARIRWDERLARRPFELVIDDRPAGTRSMPLGAFVPGGEIPWHRIRQITLGGRLVWCRERRLDRLDDLADEPDTALPAARSIVRSAAEVPSGLLPLAPRRAARPAGVSSLPMRIATLNALTDAFERDLIASDRRWAAVVDRLGELDADLIGLSEVTPALAAQLDRAGWTGAYDRSDDGDTSVRPHGQMLLSRWPIREAGVRMLAPNRRVLCCDVEAPSGPVRVLVVHLVSNATPRAAEIRREELIRTLALLADGAPAIVLGDLNLEGDELAIVLARAGLSDAWTTLLPDDPGHSFDPSRNALAALFSRDGRARRYDRILWREPGWRPCAARLFATEPLGDGGDAGLFPSDHFGVVVDLAPAAEPGALDHASPTYHSSLALVPPASCWPAIEALRAVHDRGFGRWMPHVSLLHGFTPAALLGDALERIARACRTIEPFELTLQAAGHFDHEGSRTVWLEPRGDGSLARLHEALLREFPRLGARAVFTPHLTIGRFPASRLDVATEVERALRRDWAPARWRVEAVQLLARRDERPFESVLSVGLGTGSARGGDGTRGERDPWAFFARRAASAERHARASALAAVEEAARVATAGRELPESLVEPVGSSRLCPELPGIDVDLLLVTPPGLDASSALASLDRELTARGAASRLVVGAQVAAVRASVGGVEVDVLAAERRDGGPGGAHRLEVLPEAERRAVLASLDADALERALGERREAWVSLLDLVKQWAAARSLRGQWAGFLGGISWSVLTARACLDLPELTGGALLAAFFEREAERGTPACVGLTPDDEARWLDAAARKEPPARGAPDAPLVILAPASPGRDTARTLTAATERVLRDEFRRAASLTAAVARHRAAAGELFAPVAIGGPRVEVSVDGEPGERAGRRGQAEGHLLGLIRALAATGRSPRPVASWQPSPGADRLTLLLDAADDETRTLVAAWSERVGVAAAIVS